MCTESRGVWLSKQKSRSQFMTEQLDLSRIRINTPLKPCCQAVTKVDNMLGQSSAASQPHQVQKHWKFLGLHRNLEGFWAVWESSSHDFHISFYGHSNFPVFNSKSEMGTKSGWEQNCPPWGEKGSWCRSLKVWSGKTKPVPPGSHGKQQQEYQY